MSYVRAQTNVSLPNLVKTLSLALRFRLIPLPTCNSRGYNGPERCTLVLTTYLWRLGGLARDGPIAHAVCCFESSGDPAGVQRRRRCSSSVGWNHRGGPKERATNIEQKESAAHVLFSMLPTEVHDGHSGGM